MEEQIKKNLERFEFAMMAEFNILHEKLKEMEDRLVVAEHEIEDVKKKSTPPAEKPEKKEYIYHA